MYSVAAIVSSQRTSLVKSEHNLGLLLAKEHGDHHRCFITTLGLRATEDLDFVLLDFIIEAILNVEEVLFMA